MSRFDYDDYDEWYANASELWWQSIQNALSGRKGQKALRELEQALLELPEPRLISGNLAANGQVCAVGALVVHKRVERGESREAVLAELEPVINYCTCGHSRRDHDGGPCPICPKFPQAREGWEPCRGFDPDYEDGYNGDGADHTASIGKSQAGLTYALAWRLAYLNDEDFGHISPEDRYTRVLEWVRAAQLPVPA